jgi:hypothetical protein
MASIALSAEQLLPTGSLAARPTARPSRKQTFTWSWQAIGEIASGVTFIAAFAWQVWYLGSHFHRFMLCN